MKQKWKISRVDSGYTIRKIWLHYNLRIQKLIGNVTWRIEVTIKYYYKNDFIISLKRYSYHFINDENSILFLHKMQISCMCTRVNVCVLNRERDTWRYQQRAQQINIYYLNAKVIECIGHVRPLTNVWLQTDVSVVQNHAHVCTTILCIGNILCSLCEEYSTSSDVTRWTCTIKKKNK